VKKGTFLFVLFLVLFIGIPAVAADILPPMARDILTGLFSGLPELWVQRFIIWILFLCVFFFASSFIFVDKVDKKKFHGVRITISVVLALISALAMPDAIVSGIFYSFGWATGIFALLVPILGIMYVAHQVFPQNRFGDGFRAIAFLLGMLLTMAIADSLGSFAYQPPGFSLTDLAGIVVLIFFIMAIVNGVRALFGTREKYPEGTVPDAQWNMGSDGIPNQPQQVRMVDAPGRSGRGGAGAGGGGGGGTNPPGMMTITAINPTSAPQGIGTISIVITGTNLNLLDNVSFPFNTNPRQTLQPAYPRVYNRTDTQCTADVTIGPATPAGYYDVAARARGQGDTFLRRAFQVQAGPPPPPGTPRITSIQPPSANQNVTPTGAITVTVRGDNLNLVNPASIRLILAGTPPGSPANVLRILATPVITDPTNFPLQINVRWYDAAGTIPTVTGGYSIFAQSTSGAPVPAPAPIFAITPPGTSTIDAALANFRTALVNYRNTIGAYDARARNICILRSTGSPIPPAEWTNFLAAANAIGAPFTMAGAGTAAAAQAAFNALLGHPEFSLLLAPPRAITFSNLITARNELTNYLNWVRNQYVAGYAGGSTIPAAAIPAVP
jgi:hypothetical protein